MVRLPPKSSQPVPRNADLDARDESGWLPVHWAAQSGSVETMCNLHYLGADFVSRWIWRWMIFFGMNQTRSSFLAKPVYRYFHFLWFTCCWFVMFWFFYSGELFPPQKHCHWVPGIKLHVGGPMWGRQPCTSPRSTMTGPWSRRLAWVSGGYWINDM